MVGSHGIPTPQGFLRMPSERVLVKGGSALDSLERIGCEELVHENRIVQPVYQSHR